MIKVFREGMAAAKGLEDLRGRGALKLNSQRCEETRHEMCGRDTNMLRSTES